RLYRDPDRLAKRLPTVRLLARPEEELERLAHRLAPIVAGKLGPTFRVDVISCKSQIGSGALPLETIASAGLAIKPIAARSTGRRLLSLAGALRRLPVPVIGRMAEGSLILDLRCLEDEPKFVANLI